MNSTSATSSSVNWRFLTPAPPPPTMNSPSSFLQAIHPPLPDSKTQAHYNAPVLPVGIGNVSGSNNVYSHTTNAGLSSLASLPPPPVMPNLPQYKQSTAPHNQSYVSRDSLPVGSTTSSVSSLSNSTYDVNKPVTEGRNVFRNQSPPPARRTRSPVVRSMLDPRDDDYKSRDKPYYHRGDDREECLKDRKEDDHDTYSGRLYSDREDKYESRSSGYNRERDRDRDRSPNSRGRSRDRDRDYESRRSSRYDDDDYYRSRRSRSHDRSRSRSRERNDYRSRDRRSRDRDYDRNERDNRYNVQVRERQPTPEPNATVVVKGLPVYCDEGAVFALLIDQGFPPKDVRIMKRRETGESRGFGFVEFNNVEESKAWMDHTQGRFHVDDQHTADVQYCINKSQLLMKDDVINPGGIRNIFPCGDWICSGCGTNNFKKRDQCFKCNITRDESDRATSSNEGMSEIGVAPCDTLLLRNLNMNTTEEKILASIRRVTMLEITRVVMARDPITKGSRGYAYLQMNNVEEAMQLLTAFTAVTKLNIEGKEILVSYSRLPLTTLLTGSAITQSQSQALAQAATQIQQAQQAQQSMMSQLALAVSRQQQQSVTTTAGSINTMAHLMANQSDPVAAVIQQTVLQQHQKALQLQMFQQQQLAARAIMHPGTTTALLVPQGGVPISSVVAAQEMALQVQLQHQMSQSKQQQAHAAAAIQQAQAASGYQSTSGNLGTVETPFGELPKYPPPDTSKYQYEETSGYYYDQTTGLYYDAQSQYYYNSDQQKWLYWDDNFQTFLPADTTNDDSSIITTDKDGKKKDKEKTKVAKKIQKDMAKWAKYANKGGKGGTNTTTTDGKSGGNNLGDGSLNISKNQPAAVADIGYSILSENRKEKVVSSSLVAYEGDSDEEHSNSGINNPSSKTDTKLQGDPDEIRLVDLDKKACLLCKRQFQSKEQLQKHIQLSDLHKTNLTNYKVQNNPTTTTTVEPSVVIAQPDPSGSSLYRDRAKERRLKYGLDDEAHPNKLKQKYLANLELDFEQPTAVGIGAENKGNKLLKGMGWNEGEGLGRSSQGIRDPIKADGRVGGVGLGHSSSRVGTSTSVIDKDSYQDGAKAALHARYYDACQRQ